MTDFQAFLLRCYNKSLEEGNAVRANMIRDLMEKYCER